MNTTQMVLTEEKADLYDAALDHVNDIRNELGLSPVMELQKGYVAEASKCPIALSIVQGIDDSHCASSWQRTTVYDVPVHLANEIDVDVKEHIVVDSIGMSDLSFLFQKAFDREEFPELIAE